MALVRPPSDGLEQLDLKRIEKLLNLTRSSEDGEALNAIRKVNEELDRMGLRWGKILSFSPASMDQKRFTGDQQVQSFFDYLSSCELNDWENDFVCSLEVQWEKKRRLSRKQIEVLETIHERHLRMNGDG